VIVNRSKQIRKDEQIEKYNSRTDRGLKQPQEGGFGSNHKVESCGENGNSVRTNRPSPREIS